MANIPGYSSQFRVPSARVSGISTSTSTGAALVAVGEALGQAATVAEKIEERNAVSALNAAKVTAAERLAGLRDEFQRDTDFATMPERYASRLEEVGREISEGLTDDGAREAFATAYRMQALAERKWAGGHALNLETKAVQAELVSNVERYGQLIAAAPTPEQRQSLIVDGLSQIRDAQEAGFLDPITAHTLARSFGQNADTVQARQLILDNPEVASRELRDKSRFAMLDPEVRITLTERADRRVEELKNERARLKAAAAKRYETEFLVQFDEVKDRSAEVKRALSEGRRPDAGTVADLRAELGIFAGLEKTRREGARELREFEETASAAAAVDRFMATGGAERPEGEIAWAQMEKLRTEVERDALALADVRGDVPLHPLDISDTETLARRVTDARRVKQLFDPLFPETGAPLQLFTPSEREALSRRIGEANPEEQMVIAGALQKGFGPMATRAMADLADAPKSFGLAGLLVVAGRHETARKILDGEELLGRDPNAVPGENLRSALEKGIGGAFLNQGTVRAQVIRAAQAYYVADVGGSLGEDETVNEERLDKAIQAAVGGQKIGGAMWGGMTEWNGRKIVAPTFMSQPAFRARLNGLTDSALHARSVGGVMPTMPNGAPLRADDLDKAYLVTADDGQYWVSVTDPVTQGLSLVRGGDPEGLYRLDMRPELYVGREPEKFLEDASGDWRRALTPWERDKERFAKAVDALPEMKGIFDRMKALPPDPELHDLVGDLFGSIYRWIQENSSLTPEQAERGRAVREEQDRLRGSGGRR